MRGGGGGGGGEEEQEERETNIKEIGTTHVMKSNSSSSYFELVEVSAQVPDFHAAIEDFDSVPGVRSLHSDMHLLDVSCLELTVSLLEATLDIYWKFLLWH